MKKGIKIGLKIASSLLLLAVTLLAGYIWGQLNMLQRFTNTEVNAVYLHREQFVEDFTEVSNLIKRNYSFLESKQINADSLFQVYLHYVKMAESFAEYQTLLLRYFAELRNSHINVIIRPWYNIEGSGALLVENRVFIDRVGRSTALAGVNVNDEIIAVEGVPVLEWISKQQRYISASTDSDRFRRAVWRIFSSHLPGTRTLLLNTRSGEKEVTLSFVRIPANNNNIVAHAINDYIGYIEVRSMQGNVVGEFRNQFEKLRKKPNLIIDLRRNDGGTSTFGDAMAEYLIKEEQRASVGGRRLRPQANHYEGNLIVLIGTATFSAGESFALDLKESGIATLIGSETAGCTGNRPRAFTTTFGTSFDIPTRAPQLSPQGFPMEGVGIPPHIFVYQTVEDYLNGIDTVLEFAINFASKTR